MNTITFETIEKSVRSIEVQPEGVGAAADKQSRAQRFVSIYRGIHPILVTLSVLPLLPPQFREALRLFLATTDAFTQDLGQSDPDFKAGKDV